MTGNSDSKMNEIKRKLKDAFKIKDLGEPKEYLGIMVERNKDKQELKLHQTTFIEKMLRKFGYSEAYPQRTPMVSNQVLNEERREREWKNKIKMRKTAEDIEKLWVRCYT